MSSSWDQRRNDGIRPEMQTASFVDKIRERRPVARGNVVRRGPDHVLRGVCEWPLEGRRARGRSKLTFKKNRICYGEIRRRSSGHRIWAVWEGRCRVADAGWARRSKTKYIDLRQN